MTRGTLDFFKLAGTPRIKAVASNGENIMAEVESFTLAALE